MNLIEQFGAALVLLGVGVGMVFYEWTRIKAGRPLLNGHVAVQLYWMTYLTLFVLGAVVALAAIIR